MNTGTGSLVAVHLVLSSAAVDSVAHLGHNHSRRAWWCYAFPPPSCLLLQHTIHITLNCNDSFKVANHINLCCKYNNCLKQQMLACIIVLLDNKCSLIKWATCTLNSNSSTLEPVNNPTKHMCKCWKVVRSSCTSIFHNQHTKCTVRCCELQRTTTQFTINNMPSTWYNTLQTFTCWCC